jgi:hypothetical protein
MRRVIAIKAIACTTALLASLACPAARAQTPITPTEARAVAKEAYIYGYPLADSYRISAPRVPASAACGRSG